jgi:hypothetical protein
MQMLTEIKSTRLIKMSASTAVLINEGDRSQSYQMTIPAIGTDGSLSWRLNYGGEPSRSDLHAAISIMDSYEYLLSSNITTNEAINRLRCLRREYKRLIEEQRSCDEVEAAS